MRVEGDDRRLQRERAAVLIGAVPSRKIDGDRGVRAELVLCMEAGSAADPELVNGEQKC